MWTKILTVKFDKRNTSVQVWLSETEDDDVEVVKIQAMVNEYYLVEEVRFKGRDAAHDFIKHFPNSMAIAFLNRTAYVVGAMG